MLRLINPLKGVIPKAKDVNKFVLEPIQCILFKIRGISRHEGDRLKHGSHLGVQAALLYSSPSGERMVRVHNLSLAVTEKAADLYRLADLEAVLMLRARHLALEVRGAARASVLSVHHRMRASLKADGTRSRCAGRRSRR